MPEYYSARLHRALAMAEPIVWLLEAWARQARQRAEERRPRIPRGATLRPSADTPLWNALADHIEPLLRARGDRAQLARELGVHRARVGEYFTSWRAMPDAERTLELLLWLSRRRRRAQRRIPQPPP